MTDNDQDTSEDISFDELEANYLYIAVKNHIRYNKWDPSTDSDWKMLKTLKNIEERLIDYLDGGPPESRWI